MTQNEKKSGEMISFEEALHRLDVAAEALKNNDTTLEDAIRHYEEGMSYYTSCKDILNEAKQKIEVFEDSTETLKDF